MKTLVTMFIFLLSDRYYLKKVCKSIFVLSLYLETLK